MSEETNLNQNAGDNSEQYASFGNMEVNKPELHIHNTSQTYTDYLALVEEFEKELDEGNTTILEFIDKIQHYTSVVDEKVIGLHEKLKRAGYEKQYWRVNHLKERYAKELTENELSKATQKIHAYILAQVWKLFLLHINPAIDEGYSKAQISKIMDEQVVKPVELMLSSKNVLNIYPDDIIGMIYFLTGNCHITWD